MATSKSKKADSKSTDVNFRSVVRDPMVPKRNDSDKDEPHVPFTLLISLLVMCIVLIIALPVMGIMYMDMNNATNVAMEEIKKMRELRAKIMLQMQGEQ